MCECLCVAVAFMELCEDYQMVCENGGQCTYDETLDKAHCQ